MAQRYIYLPDKMNACLKQEENASALIVRLLNDYYNSLNQKVEEVKPIINILEQSVKEQDKENLNETVRNSILEEVERQNKEIAEADLLLRSDKNDF